MWARPVALASLARLLSIEWWQKTVGWVRRRNQERRMKGMKPVGR